MKNNLKYTSSVNTTKNFYVYVFLNTLQPGVHRYGRSKFEYEPFYIGKGVNDRIDNQFRDKSVNDKSKEIEAKGGQVLRIKIYENLSELKALKKESILIKKIGQIINETGPLYNTELITDFNKIRHNRKTRKEKDKKQKQKYNSAINELANFLTV